MRQQVWSLDCEKAELKLRLAEVEEREQKSKRDVRANDLLNAEHINSEHRVVLRLRKCPEREVVQQRTRRSKLSSLLTVSQTLPHTTS